VNGAALTLGLASLAAFAGARRGARQAPVPKSVIEEAEADAKAFLGDFPSWRADFEDEPAFDLFYGRLDRIFGRDRVLGGGTQRVVLASKDPRYVIKVTPWPMYNLDEAEVWRDAGPETRKMLVPVVAVDPMGRWLIMERVEPSSWSEGEEDYPPGIEDLKRRFKALGFLDFQDHNLSADGRIYDYAESVNVKGSPARAVDLSRLLEIVKKYRGQELDMPASWRPFLRDMKEAGFESVGSGSTRYVYALDGDRVAKIDYDPGGSVNRAEYDFWRMLKEQGAASLLVPILEIKEGGRVLIMARAEPVPDSRAKEISRARRSLPFPRDEADFDFNWGIHNGAVKLLDYSS